MGNGSHDQASAVQVQLYYFYKLQNILFIMKYYEHLKHYQKSNLKPFKIIYCIQSEHGAVFTPTYQQPTIASATAPMRT
jgi:hypothetical protein